MDICPDCSNNLDPDSLACPHCGFEEFIEPMPTREPINHWQGLRRAAIATFFALFFSWAQLKLAVVATSWIAPWWTSRDSAALQAKSSALAFKNPRWYRWFSAISFVAIFGGWYATVGHQPMWFLYMVVFVWTYMTWYHLFNRRQLLRIHRVELEWWQLPQNVAVGAGLLGLAIIQL